MEERATPVVSADPCVDEVAVRVFSPNATRGGRGPGKGAVRRNGRADRLSTGVVLTPLHAPKADKQIRISDNARSRRGIAEEQKPSVVDTTSQENGEHRRKRVHLQDTTIAMGKQRNELLAAHISAILDGRGGTSQSSFGASNASACSSTFRRRQQQRIMEENRQIRSRLREVRATYSVVHMEEQHQRRKMLSAQLCRYEREDTSKAAKRRLEASKTRPHPPSDSLNSSRRNPRGRRLDSMVSSSRAASTVAQQERRSRGEHISDYDDDASSGEDTVDSLLEVYAAGNAEVVNQFFSVEEEQAIKKEMDAARQLRRDWVRLRRRLKRTLKDTQHMGHNYHTWAQLIHSAAVQGNNPWADVPTLRKAQKMDESLQRFRDSGELLRYGSNIVEHVASPLPTLLAHSHAVTNAGRRRREARDARLQLYQSYSPRGTIKKKDNAVAARKTQAQRAREAEVVLEHEEADVAYREELRSLREHHSAALGEALQCFLLESADFVSGLASTLRSSLKDLEADGCEKAKGGNVLDTIHFAGKRLSVFFSGHTESQQPCAPPDPLVMAPPLYSRSNLAGKQDSVPGSTMTHLPTQVAQQEHMCTAADLPPAPPSHYVVEGAQQEHVCTAAELPPPPPSHYVNDRDDENNEMDSRLTAKPPPPLPAAAPMQGIPLQDDNNAAPGGSCCQPSALPHMPTASNIAGGNSNDVEKQPAPLPPPPPSTTTRTGTVTSRYMSRGVFQRLGALIREDDPSSWGLYPKLPRQN